MVKKKWLMFGFILIVPLGICALSIAMPHTATSPTKLTPAEISATSDLIVEYESPKVPQPATLFLLGTGLIGVAVGGRKKMCGQ